MNSDQELTMLRPTKLLVISSTNLKVYNGARASIISDRFGENQFFRYASDGFRARILLKCMSKSGLFR